jgi:hypothetical protein
MLAQPGDHGVDHARIDRRGGAIVHVDGEMRGLAHGCKLLLVFRQTAQSAAQRAESLRGQQTQDFVEHVAEREDRIRSVDADRLDHRNTGNRPLDCRFCPSTRRLWPAGRPPASAKTRVEVFEHPLVQRRPQLMGHTRPPSPWQFSLPPQWVASMRLIHRDDDVGNRNVAALRPREYPPPGTAGGLDQLVAAQLAEELLKIRQGDLLTLADRSKGDRAGALPQRQDRSSR